MTEVGWKYDHAFISREKYKEGRFILEKAKLLKLDWIVNDYGEMEGDEDVMPFEEIF